MISMSSLSPASSWNQGDVGSGELRVPMVTDHRLLYRAKGRPGEQRL